MDPAQGRPKNEEPENDPQLVPPTTEARRQDLMMPLPFFLRKLVARIEICGSGYFADMGWFVTRARRQALDRQGNPTPWFTYPALRFLDQRIDGALSVIEFGAGMGTLWWAARSKQVVAIEHDPAWADMIRKRCNATVSIVSGDSAAAYLAAANFQERFDIVIVDGLFRNECLAAAVNLVTPQGVVILDDAQRADYLPGIGQLKQHGFRELRFYGPAPVSKQEGCTAIFYRNQNVFGI